MGTILKQPVSSPIDILNFPHVGTQRTQWRDGTVTPKPAHLLYLGGGNDGIVRKIWFTLSLGETATWPDLLGQELHIYTGTGTLADPALKPTTYTTRTIIPLATLLGANYDPIGPHISTAPGQVLNKGWDVANSRDTGDSAFSFKFPIPFADGILIQLWTATTNITAGIGFAWVAYEIGPLPSWKYKDWRLKADAVGTHPAAKNSDVTWLNVTSNPGMLVALACSMDDPDTGDPAWLYLEENFSLYPDGNSTPVWQTSGTEDLFGVNGYWFMLGAVQNPDNGTTFIDAASRIFEGYALFLDAPIFWTNGCVGKFHVSNDAHYTTDGLNVDILALYYAP